MTVTDQMGRSLTFNYPPRRIVSLVPSQTELLFDLGLDEEIVGITWFCVHPADKFNGKTKIGGTKKLKFDRIAELKPDLIIGNKEENDRAQIEELEKHHPVWMSDINSVADALEMIRTVGAITDRKGLAETMAYEIERRITEFKQTVPVMPVKTAYLIWRNPWMGAAGGTYINEMMRLCGFENVLKNYTTENFDPESHSLRYPQFVLDELTRLNPELVLLSSEPYPFAEKHINEIRQALPQAEIHLVDGEMFSWYGTRMLHSPAYFSQLLRRITNVEAVI